jgi:lysophospholipase L1-like esterase
VSTRRPLSIVRRLGFALLATLLFFVLLEGVLSGVAGVAWWWQVGRHNPPAQPAARAAAEGRPFRIVAFGDSVTAGQGTAPLYSYPRQLETLLTTLNPDPRFEVVNNGVFALNSSRLADLMPGWLAEFKPDVAIVMSGCNNPWNYRNSHLYALGLAERSRLQWLRYHSRVYRALRLLVQRRRGGVGISEREMLQPVLRDKMRISESVSPAVDPTAQTLERQRKIFQDQSGLAKLMRHDLGLMRDHARRAGVHLVLMTYPFRPPYHDHRGTVRNYAIENGIPLVDNYAAFEAAKSRQPGLDLFSADRGHPNASGYRVLATGAYEVLRSHGQALGLSLAPPPDPLGGFKDPAYLADLLEELRRATARPGADEYTWETLGHVAMELELYRDAEAAFRKAYAISGGAPQFYESLGNLFVREQAWERL